MKLAHVVFGLALALAGFQLTAKPGAPRQFVVISDIHFNPLADPSLTPNLLAAEPDQWEAIFAGDQHPPAPKYGDDTTWPLLNALVSGLRKVEPKPQLIILTGDILPHKFAEKFANPAAFRSLVKKTVTFISMELEKAAGGVPVIYTLGNNDEECGDYALQPDGPFLHDMEEPVQTLAQLDASALTKWLPLGSYVRTNPLVPHHRIISLNTNFWSRRYVNSCADKTATAVDPGEAELSWLAAELKDAHDHGDKVWLVYHIPPGIDGHASSVGNAVLPMWKPVYADGFNKLLDEYRKTIEMNLAGHTHLDDIRLIKTEHADTLVLINPAVSPNVGQNPAFRVITVNLRGEPEDMMTYYMPNLDTLQWELEYSTRSAYGMQKIDAKSYAALYRQIDASPSVSDKWKMYYSVSRLAGLRDNKTYVRSLYCATGNSSAEAYQACLSEH